MVHGTEAHIILDESLTRAHPPLIELEALAGKAVALLVCQPERIRAKIFRKPNRHSTFISLSDGRGLTETLELRPQQPVVDFEVIEDGLNRR